MSLPAFHILFISLSTFTAFAAGAWCIAQVGARGPSMYLYLGVASFIVGALLVIYGVLFFKKLRSLDL